MIGYLLIKHLSDRVRFLIGCAMFDLTLVGMCATMLLTSEPPWILALSWLALTLTAADIVSTQLVLKRGGEEDK